MYVRPANSTFESVFAVFIVKSIGNSAPLTAGACPVGRKLEGRESRVVLGAEEGPGTAGGPRPVASGVWRKPFRSSAVADARFHGLSGSVVAVGGELELGLGVTAGPRQARWPGRPPRPPAARAPEASRWGRAVGLAASRRGDRRGLSSWGWSCKVANGVFLDGLPGGVVHTHFKCTAQRPHRCPACVTTRAAESQAFPAPWPPDPLRPGLCRRLCPCEGSCEWGHVARPSACGSFIPRCPCEGSARPSALVPAARSR